MTCTHPKGKDPHDDGEPTVRPTDRSEKYELKHSPSARVCERDIGVTFEGDTGSGVGWLLETTRPDGGSALNETLAEVVPHSYPGKVNLCLTGTAECFERAAATARFDPGAAKRVGQALLDVAGELEAAADPDSVLEEFDVSRGDLGSTRITVSETATAYVYDEGDDDQVVLSELWSPDGPVSATLTVDEARRLRDDLDDALDAIAAERANYDQGEL